MTSKEDLLVLNAIPGLNGKAVQRIMESFNSIDELFSQDFEGLLEFGLNQNLIRNILHFPKDKFLDAEYNLLQKKGADFITILDLDYPLFLKDIPLAPIVLYTMGNKSLLRSSCIAVVGCRKASSYGMKTAQEFSRDFAQAGITVVSGLAYGIDTASHKAVLEAKGNTIAVLGCGLNHIYPKENLALYGQIAQEGLLVSEFPMNTAPIDYNFPRRNRIVSGLSLATVVIEAALKSGALITADYALSQQKEVFAVPGNIDSPTSQGTNQLIKDGSKLALSAWDVLEQLQIEIKSQIQQQSSKDRPHVQLSMEEYRIFEAIEHQPSHIDDIALRCGQEIGQLMGEMLHLELKGVIKQLPGQYYVRN